MKKLLLTACIMVHLTLRAQDSTSISFSTETVQEFKRQSLMEEFDRAFGTDRSVSTRLKAGLMDFSSGRLPHSSLYLSIEQRIGKRLSASFSGIVISKDALMFPDNYAIKELIKGDMQLALTYAADLKFYFKACKSLSGDYLGLEFRNFYGDEHTDYMPVVINYRPYIAYNQLALNLGKQFGSMLDIGVQLGLKNARRPLLNGDGLIYTHKKENKSFIPFIGTYSRIGLGLNFPRLKRNNSESCDFLNCYNEFQSLFKVNLSNAFYLDPFQRNIKADIAYERKLGRLPFSVEASLMSSLFSERKFKPTGQYGNSEELGRAGFPTFFSTKENKTFIDLVPTFKLKYFLFQNRAIAKGKAANNLSGEYVGAYYSNRAFLTNSISADNSMIRNSFHQRNAGYGIVVGTQKKILKNYFYDFSLRFNLASKQTNYYYGLGQEIKFGYAF